MDTKGFKEVPKCDVPNAAQKVGTPLTAHGPQEEETLIHMCEVKQGTVVLDFNHPLAGKTLTFDVKVVGIEEAA